MKIFGSVNRSRSMSLCVCVGVGRDCVYLCVCSVAQSFPTLWNPMDCSPPGSCVHGIFQKKFWRRLPYLLQGVFLTQESSPHLLRLLHWQADFLPLSRLSCCCAQSRLTLCDPVDCSLPDSFVHEFSRQEYWSGFPFPSPGDLPNSGIKPASLPSPALAGRYFLHCATWEALYFYFL